MTWSIVARDAQGHFGVAIASRFFAVGALCMHTRRGVGVTVSEKAPKVCRETTVTLVKGHLMDAVAECVASGLPGTEIRKVVSETIEAGVLPYRGNHKKR